mgnify:CR=1 FL=1
MDLLGQLQGREVTIMGEPVTLDTTGIQLVPVEPDWRARLLAVIADPNVAYVLMLIGIYGLFFEFANPGYVLPGVAGAIALVLALYAFQILPVNYAGMCLILLGVVLLILDVKVTSFGGLTIGGVTALVLGSLLLFDSPEPWARVSLRVMIPAVSLFAAFFVLCVWLVVRGQRRPVSSGPQSLVGEQGRVVEAIGGGEVIGKVVFHGEIWDAVAEVAISVDALVVVTAVKGRLVRVRPLTAED